MITVLGDDNLAVAGAVMALMLATSAIAQLAGQRLESPRTQTVGLVVMICGVIALIVAVLDKALAVLLVAAVLAGIGQGFAFMGSLCDVRNRGEGPQRETSSQLLCRLHRHRCAHLWHNLAQAVEKTVIAHRGELVEPPTNDVVRG